MPTPCSKQAHGKPLLRCAKHHNPAVVSDCSPMSLIARKRTRVKLSFRKFLYLAKQTTINSDPTRLKVAHTWAAASNASCSLELRDELAMCYVCVNVFLSRGGGGGGGRRVDGQTKAGADPALCPHRVCLVFCPRKNTEPRKFLTISPLAQSRRRKSGETSPIHILHLCMSPRRTQDLGGIWRSVCVQALTLTRARGCGFQEAGVIAKLYKR